MDITTASSPDGKQSAVRDRRRKASDSHPDTQHIGKSKRTTDMQLTACISVSSKDGGSTNASTTATGQTRESQTDTDMTMGESTDVSNKIGASRTETSITCKLLSWSK